MVVPRLVRKAVDRQQNRARILRVRELNVLEQRRRSGDCARDPHEGKIVAKLALDAGPRSEKTELAMKTELAGDVSDRGVRKQGPGFGHAAFRLGRRFGAR